MPMEMFMKDNGLMIKLMVMEFINTLMEPNSGENGLKINKREKVERSGQMEAIIKDSI